MFKSLFGKKNKRVPASKNISETDSIRDASVGDVFLIQGLSLEYDDAYFFIEEIDRYETPSGEWYEVAGADGENKVWVEWSQGRELFITATDNRKPEGLSSIGITEEELMRVDEEHSIDNYITVDDQRYYYRNSSEAFYFRDNRGEGEGFYLWDFMSEDEHRVLSITKWEGIPFESFFGEVIPPDNVTIYKGERAGQTGQESR